MGVGASVVQGGEPFLEVHSPSGYIWIELGWYFILSGFSMELANLPTKTSGVSVKQTAIAIEVLFCLGLSVLTFHVIGYFDLTFQLFLNFIASQLIGYVVASILIVPGVFCCRLASLGLGRQLRKEMHRLREVECDHISVVVCIGTCCSPAVLMAINNATLQY